MPDKVMCWIIGEEHVNEHGAIPINFLASFAKEETALKVFDMIKGQHINAALYYAERVELPGEIMQEED